MFPRKIIRDNINNKDCDAFIIINNEKLLFVEKLYDYFRIEYDDVANRNTYLLKIYKKKYKEYSFCYNIELNEEFYKNIENIDVKSFENEEDLEKFMDIKKFKKSKSDAFKVIYTSEKSSAICMILKKRKELLMYKKKESLNKEVEIFIKGGFNDIFDEMVR